jgi:hypothetical protein
MKKCDMQPKDETTLTLPLLSSALRPPLLPAECAAAARSYTREKGGKARTEVLVEADGRAAAEMWDADAVIDYDNDELRELSMLHATDMRGD